MARTIAITGGIGSGKSVVCRILATLGLKVYDCDSRAKILMDKDPEIHRRLSEEISPETVSGGIIDRPRLAEIVFSDAEKLSRLNGIVHHRVLEDIEQWKETNAGEKVLFVETAILLESNLHRRVDAVWLVEATEDTRLRRACLRDNAGLDAVRARMSRQRRVTSADLHVPLITIDNEGDTPLLPRILSLLEPYGVTASIPGQWSV